MLMAGSKSNEECKPGSLKGFSNPNCDPSAGGTLGDPVAKGEGRASGGAASYSNVGFGGSSTLAVPVLFSCGRAGAVKATPGVLAGTGSATHSCTDCPKPKGNCKVKKAVPVKRSSLLTQQQQAFDRNLEEKHGWVLHPHFE